MVRMTDFSQDLGGTMTSDMERLNALLRGELAAFQTYSDALHRIGSHWGAGTLFHIRSDHHEAADWLRERIRHAGAQPAECPGMWSVFASLVDTVEPVGMATILAALKQGEQVAINEYEQALYHDDVDDECREHIHTRLIPDGHRHLLELDHLLAQDSRA